MRRSLHKTLKFYYYVNFGIKDLGYNKKFWMKVK